MVSSGNVKMLARFVRKLKAELGDAGGAPIVEVLAGLLCFGAEHCIAATHVGHHGMRAAGIVAQCYNVMLAWTAAVLIARAGREEAAKDAVFGVKDRQVLIGDHFYSIAAGVSGKLCHLRRVEIMRGRDAIHAHRQK